MKKNIETLYYSIFQIAQDGILILDPFMICVDMNDNAEHLLSGSKKNLEGLSINDIFFSDYFKYEVSKDIYTKCTIKDDILDYNDTYFIRSDRQKYIKLTISKLEDGYLLVILKDVTESKKKEAELLFNAFHDTLTGLANRNLFMDRINHAIDISKRNASYVFALLFLDLDNFKSINDTYGHLVGDDLLKEVARRLNTIMRASDTISRFGGDEFTILMENVSDPTNISIVANRILKSLSTPFIYKDLSIPISTSIGIAFSKTSVSSANDILNDADKALYQAKRQGKGTYEFSSTVEPFSVPLIKKLEKDIDKALNRNEFVLFYQPIVSFKGGNIQGYEALIRWRHPEHGLISPEEFIPIAERTGLINDIGEWVLKQACHQNKLMQSLGHDGLYLSVNFSAKQFQSPKLTAMVENVLEETRMDANRLVIEITESSIIQDVEHCISVMKNLRNMGIFISIDDFGVGYSSLSYLIKLPVNNLKLDKFFIHNIASMPDLKLVTNAIIRLAHDLNLKVIAEGVETDAQLSYLNGLNCEAFQGFHYSKPVEYSDFLNLLQNSRQA